MRKESEGVVRNIIGVAFGVLLFNFGAAFGHVAAERARTGRDAQYERLLRGNAHGALIGFEAIRDLCEDSMEVAAGKVAKRYISQLEEALK